MACYIPSVLLILRSACLCVACGQACKMVPRLWNLLFAFCLANYQPCKASHSCIKLQSCCLQVATS